MPTRNINLTDHYDGFVDELISAGKYANASEVLRAGLRLLELQSRTEEEKLSLLKKLAAEGFEALDQGQGIPVSGDEGLAEAIRRIGVRAARQNDEK